MKESGGLTDITVNEKIIRLSPDRSPNPHQIMLLLANEQILWLLLRTQPGALIVTTLRHLGLVRLDPYQLFTSSETPSEEGFPAPLQAVSCTTTDVEKHEAWICTE